MCNYRESHWSLQGQRCTTPLLDSSPTTEEGAMPKKKPKHRDDHKEHCNSVVHDDQDNMDNQLSNGCVVDVSNLG
jgi:hypothetical protein